MTNITQEIKKLRSEMKANGIRKISCFNAGLTLEEYSCNRRLFELNTKLSFQIKDQHSILSPLEVEYFEIKPSEGEYLLTAVLNERGRVLRRNKEVEIDSFDSVKDAKDWARIFYKGSAVVKK